MDSINLDFDPGSLFDEKLDLKKVIAESNIDLQ